MDDGVGKVAKPDPDGVGIVRWVLIAGLLWTAGLIALVL